MKTKIELFIKNEDGQGMVEYALILTLVALAAVAGVTLLGNSTNELFKKAITSIPS